MDVWGSVYVFVVGWVGSVDVFGLYSLICEFYIRLSANTAVRNSRS